MAARTIREEDTTRRPGLTSEQVWRAVTRASFAVLSHVTPAGEPRFEITPVGAFRTYGVGVSLRTMLNPAAAQASVPVAVKADTR